MGQYGPVMDKMILQKQIEVLDEFIKEGKLTKEEVADKLKLSVSEVEGLLENEA